METTTKTSNTTILYGLYAITPCSSIQPLSTSELLSKIEQAITGGARVVQYREKQHTAEIKREQAQAIKSLCQRYSVCFLINDDVELAAEVQSDGVHLGQDDVSLRLAQERLGSSAIIGISCYNQLALAIDAQQQGADYVAFGRFFSSQSKPGAVQADISLLQQAKTRLSIPVACIGGISAENAKLLTSAGADMLAVINSVFGASDVAQAARDLSQYFS